MKWEKLLLRAALTAIITVVVFLLGAFVVERTLERRDASNFPPPGRLVELDDGRRMHLQCAGTGQPTVFMEMGAGAWGVFWTEIRQRVAEVTRTCTYDRAGLGWSDPGPPPRGPDALLQDLRATIEASGEPGPFVLAGHSLGGWIVRLYQARYPEDVVGLALVESAHPRQWSELPPEIWQTTRSVAGTMSAMAPLGRVGMFRLMTDQLASQRLPPDVMDAYRAMAVRPSAVATRASEMLTSDLVAAQVDELGGLGDLPLVVVTAGRSFDGFRAMAPDWPFEQADRIWTDLQSRLLELSTHSWQHVSPSATHDIHTDDPGLVVQALTELVDTVRDEAGSPVARETTHQRALPSRSTPPVDSLLQKMEEAYRSMDAERWVSLFTEDVEQIDVPRRVHLKGRDAWRMQTESINAAHRQIDRVHHGRAVVGDWVIVEIEWAGTVRGEALGTPGQDRRYSYSGIGLLHLDGTRVGKQIIYGDVTTLDERLGSG
jgi:uncharacterized protein (TIGR02246 family)